MPNWNSFSSFLEDALDTPPEDRQPLVNALLRERPDWPWVAGREATFIHVAMGDEQSVAINLDTLDGDPPFAVMDSLEGTTLWYRTLEFNEDDLLDYMLAINDPMTPLAQDRNIVQRIGKHWRNDPFNPTRMQTAQMTVSVVRMEKARPFPDWSKMTRVKHGTVVEHSINSSHLRFTGRKLWVYTPPNYDDYADRVLPLLVLQDGQWCVGPLQVPLIADALIKHNRLQPIVIAMIQSGDQKDRIKTFVSNDKHYEFLLDELLPFIKTRYRVDSVNLGVGGVSAGGIAAAHAALKNPAVFSNLMMISPPLGKGPAQDQLLQYAERFQTAEMLPKRIFQSVGRYETRARFLLPAQLLRNILRERDDIVYRYAQVGSGHGLVAFRSIIPEALAWIFPG